MRIIIGTDYYYPSVGGLQFVIKEISERLVQRGHTVTIVTSKMEDRKVSELNGVKIKEFNVSGSYIHGLKGNIKEYQNFILSENYDVLMLKSAQSWTLDSLIPVLDLIIKRKIFIPCGFSALYNHYYADYYTLMPDILKKFDHLIFYASEYRDINFAKNNGINNYSVIPNGASEIEFTTEIDNTFRDRLNIKNEDYLILTVGSFTGGKGHYELAQAFQRAQFDKPASLLLNGNIPYVIPETKLIMKIKLYFDGGINMFLRRLFRIVMNFFKFSKKNITRNWTDIAREVNSSNSNKNIYITNLKRSDVIQAFFNADLFVFASNIEYSPLVLFESAAAGLPFLTVPVGNSEEIIQWTQGGVLCPSEIDKNGRTVVDPDVLAVEIVKIINNPKKRYELGVNGNKNWLEKFTWEKITVQYENILKGN